MFFDSRTHEIEMILITSKAGLTIINLLKIRLNDSHNEGKLFMWCADTLVLCLLLRPCTINFNFVNLYLSEILVRSGILAADVDLQLVSQDWYSRTNTLGTHLLTSERRTAELTVGLWKVVRTRFEPTTLRLWAEHLDHSATQNLTDDWSTKWHDFRTTVPVRYTVPKKFKYEINHESKRRTKRKRKI